MQHPLLLLWFSYVDLDKSFVKSISYPLQLPMLPAFNRFLLSPEEAAAVANREREEGGGGGAGGGATEQVGCKILQTWVSCNLDF